MTYTIALCEIFNKNLHGFNSNSTHDMEQRILATYTFSKEEFMNKDVWLPVILNMQHAYSQLSPNVKTHSCIRNYSAIVNEAKYYTLDIVQLEEMPGGEMCAIIKTGAIRRFQKKWRKHLKQKRDMIQERSKPSNIRQREITGKWASYRFR